MLHIQRFLAVLSLFLTSLFCTPLTVLGDSGFVLWEKGASNFIKAAWHIRKNYDTLKKCDKARNAAFQEALVSIENYKTNHTPDMKLTVNYEHTQYVTTEPVGRVYSWVHLSFHCISGDRDPH